MGKTTHYQDKTTGKIIRETKIGNKITREEISQAQLDNYETGSSMFGCVGAIFGLIFFLWLLTNIFGSSL